MKPARAVQGLLSLESDPEKQLKYIDFIDIYSALDDNEMNEYTERYPQESKTMASLSERLRAEGMAGLFSRGGSEAFRKACSKANERSWSAC